MITIAVDAMGGDFGLEVTVPAAAYFLNNHPNVQLIMVGDQEQLSAAVKVHAAHVLDRVTIEHSTEVVLMDEAPQIALKNKKNSSMRLAINLVKEGRAQAIVSAGNTGALMATARFVLKTLTGVDRPAIAKFMPNAQQGVTCVLDLGANVDNTPEQLLQFAIMGSELASAVLNKPEPKIGLLNIGEEEIKGNELTKNTYPLLKASGLNFVGNVEGNDIFKGNVDVVVTDGFVGNVALKSVEGIAKMISETLKAEFTRSLFTRLCALVSLPVLNALKKRVDTRRYNGAIFLGLKGIVIKSHGGTDSVGFGFALQEAYEEVKNNVIERMEQGMITQMNKLNASAVSQNTTLEDKE
ncbi:phosphate acyltransferase PlsX [Neisseria sp. Ec49-e6-T10]|uniref:phosphate acyltransferase PlsX n=1 Tax=Neisseria sp. Ec49-e6-T10 TaxID=3140744 RepID=UPI003EBC5ED1